MFPMMLMLIMLLMLIKMMLMILVLVLTILMMINTVPDLQKASSCWTNCHCDHHPFWPLQQSHWLTCGQSQRLTISPLLDLPFMISLVMKLCDIFRKYIWIFCRLNDILSIDWRFCWGRKKQELGQFLHKSLSPNLNSLSVVKLSKNFNVACLWLSNLCEIQHLFIGG